MKIRYGFVTNSSSSSFIVRATKPIAEKYKNWLGKDMTKDNYINIMIEEHYIDTETYGYTGISKEDAMRLLGVDERAYLLFCLATEDYENLMDYFEIAKYFEANPDAVLNTITLDWGMEYNTPEIKEFMEAAEIVLKSDNG